MASQDRPPDEPHIARLEFDANRSSRRADAQNAQRNLLDDDVSFMNEVAEGIIERDRKNIQIEAARTLSFVWSIISCLCAGSITTFSLYGPRFLEDLHYTQYQVNAVSIAGEIALYLSVPIFGYICDRYSPRPLSFLAALLSGGSYLLAAFTYRSGAPDQGGWPHALMVLAFVGIGSGTLCMYIAAVTTCAKNYATAKYRGLVLSMPIAAFGLSGMWISLVGDHLLSDRLPDGSKGHVNVFRYFIFLAGLIFGVGIVGGFVLNVLDVESLIDHGIESLEQSGLLGESDYFRSSTDHINYGTLNNDGEHASDHESENELNLTTSQFLKHREEQERLKAKRNWLLNFETRAFLTDRSMWLLAAGFLLATGPGEAYINNLGTIIPTLTPPKYFDPSNPPAGLASTHVSIIAFTSTFARIFTGTVSDLFAPLSRPRNSPSPRFRFSRLALLLPSALVLSLGFINLGLPFLTPSIPSLFYLSSVCVGLGYGALFSLTPIIISVVWGPENFGTNWGVIAMTPAGGATLWSLVYSVGYSRTAAQTSGQDIASTMLKEGECHGYHCFGEWAWGCALSGLVAMMLWGFAWRLWLKKSVVV